MVEETSGLIVRIKRFFKENAAEYAFDKIVLFGSRAEGSARRDSDVDLMLVSKKFEGKAFHERAVQLHLAWDLKLPVDFVCLTPGEFREKSCGATLVRHALEHGIALS